GGSMGGFGVSALANPLGINRMLLFNPISSLHSKKADFKYRFKSARTSLDWDCLYNDGADANATGYIIYDPFFRVDALHANRYQNLTKLKFPGVGHSTPTHLSKINALKWVFSSFLNGEISRLDFGNKIRRKRKYKHYYSWMLSEKNNHLTPKRKEIIEKYYDVYRLTEGKAIIPRKEDVDYLRDMAVKYEDFDLRMSFDIMNMAARIRPEGLYIKKKLEEYGLKLKV
ncbi:hypothetical protein NPJ88_007485, partial [Halomonas elongata]|uniref:hypothetical protein n=1 Tax=Halomonas elongata TaxID=2746 RepID=UPI00255AC733